MDESSRVGVCSRSFSRNETLRKEILDRHHTVKFNESGLSFDASSLIEFLEDCTAAIIALERISEEVLCQLPNLEAISKFGVGLNNIDLVACEKYNVRVGWTAGVNASAVAELAIIMMLSLLRKVPESQHHVLRGGWQQVVGRQLAKATVGLIGCGNVGKEVVKLLQPFQAEVVAFDILPDREFSEEYGVRFVDLNSLLESSDVVSLHIPLTDENRDFMSPSRIRLLKENAILINTARGGVLNEDAALSALKTGRLGGLGLDVLETEPPMKVDRFDDPRILLTSHIGGSSETAILSMGRAAIEGLQV